MQVAVAECQVGLVAQQALFFIAAMDLANTVKLFCPALLLLVPYQGNTEVVAQVRCPVLAAAGILQDVNGFLVVALFQ